jgi:hypothetical protein
LAIKVSDGRSEPRGTLLIFSLLVSSRQEQRRRCGVQVQGSRVSNLAIAAVRRKQPYFLWYREAYQILSDPDSRAFYDKVGKSKMSEVAGGEGGMEMQDPSALFGSLFGGERFKDLIGEISLVKGEP